MLKAIDMNPESEQDFSTKKPRRVQNRCCFFTKKRTGRSVMIPSDRIWVIDISHCSGDTMVRTYDGDVVVLETFDKVVETIRDVGVNVCIFHRRECQSPLCLPMERIVRIEKSERDREGATLVITVDGRICVSDDIESAVEIVRSCGGDICTFHKRLDNGNPCYAMRSKINGIRMSQINGDTVVQCGESRIVVTEGFDEACRIYGGSVTNP